MKQYFSAVPFINKHFTNKPFTNKVFRKYLTQALSILLIASLLSACGFRPRGEYLIAPELKTLTITSTDKYGELTRLVKEHFQFNDVKIVNGTSELVPELHILQDRLDRRQLSVFPNGQIAEYEIIYTVQYQVLIGDKEPQFFEFELNRDYQDDPNFALAKSRELNLLLNEMRKTAADRILRSMASIRID